MDNFIVSARKYRPTAFQAVVGQHALTETLQNAIATGHLASAYLFCGPRGVGKTTCARIFAKAINAISAEDNLDQYAFNIHELDAASNNSVEDIRSIIKEVMVPPQQGRYSVFIIDEVHMLSTGAFNALLKTLEEPPSYAIFILATTEKHKVLPTILSRCQVYDFARITVADIIAHLQYVAAQEGVTIGEDSLNVIAQKADGGMRDALSTFDQLVSFAGKEISYERTVEVLGVLDCEYYFRLTDAVRAGDVSTTLLLLDEVLSTGFDPQQFIIGYSQHLRDLLVSKDPATLPLLQTSESIARRYAEQAGQIAAPMLFRMLDVMTNLDMQFRLARNKRLTLELYLIRLPQLFMAPAVPANPAAPAAPANPANPGVPANPVKPAAPAAPAKPANPVTSTGPIPSISLKGIAQMQAAKPTAPAGTQTTEQKEERTPFSDDRLMDVWAGLQKRYPTETRLRALLEEHYPVRQTEEQLLLTVSNTLQRDLFQQFGKDIMNHVRRELHNSHVSLNLKIAEMKVARVAYTSEEKYKLLLESNPALETLKQLLDLQLE